MLLTSVESESGVSKVGCKVGGCRQGRKRERCTECKCISHVVRFYISFLQFQNVEPGKRCTSSDRDLRVLKR